MQQSISSSHNNNYRSNNYLSQHDDEEQQQNYFRDFQQMIFRLKQQQLAPQLLHYNQSLFQKLKKKLKQQQKSLQQTKQPQIRAEISTSAKNSQLQIIMYSMEIEKISYVLKQYLKVRLDKIQKCSMYYFKNMPTAEKLMSKAEIQFLKKYVKSRYAYYQKNIFKTLVKNFRGVGGMELFLDKPQQIKLVNSNRTFILYRRIESQSNVIEPDLKSYVFVKMNRNPHEFRYKIDLPIYDVPNEQSQIASSNDILFIPYGVAKSLMEKSDQGDLVLM